MIFFAFSLRISSFNISSLELSERSIGAFKPDAKTEAESESGNDFPVATTTVSACLKYFLLISIAVLYLSFPEILEILYFASVFSSGLSTPGLLVSGLSVPGLVVPGTSTLSLSSS